MSRTLGGRRWWSRLGSIPISVASVSMGSASAACGTMVPRRIIYPEPAIAVFSHDLLPIRDPIPVPPPQGSRVMHPDRVDALDLEPGAFQLIDEPAQRRRRIRPREDVLVHEQAPDEILILPGLPQPRDLEEEHPVIIEHVVHLSQEGREVPHAHMLGHLETGDLVVPALRHGDIAVVHAQDPALIFFDPGLPQPVVAPCCLIPPQGDPRRAGAVVGARVFGQGAPSAANVEHALPALEPNLLAHHAQLVILQLLQAFFLGDVRDDARGIDHARTQEPAVEIVAAVVVVADLLFV